MEIEGIIEALLIASETPLPSGKLCEIIQNIEKEKTIAQKNIEEAIQKLNISYEEENRSFSILQRSQGWQIVTKPIYYSYLEQLFPEQAHKRLSKSALETLAIIAYKQPVIRNTLEEIRGVSCDSMVQKLLEYELIQINGTADLPGKPQLLETTEKFLDYFGLLNLQELPQEESSEEEKPPATN